jgi:hypothetical protein
MLGLFFDLDGASSRPISMRVDVDVLRDKAGLQLALVDVSYLSPCCMHSSTQHILLIYAGLYDTMRDECLAFAYEAVKSPCRTRYIEEQ